MLNLNGNMNVAQVYNMTLPYMIQHVMFIFENVFERLGYEQLILIEGP